MSDLVLPTIRMTVKKTERNLLVNVYLSPLARVRRALYFLVQVAISSSSGSSSFSNNGNNILLYLDDANYK